MSINFRDLERQVNERGRIQILDNGLTLISENVPGSGLATGEITIYAGSCYEKPEDHGIIHFLEHVSFEGSRLYPDKDARNLQAGIIGLDINASTCKFEMYYPVRGANDSRYMLQKNFSEGFRIMTDTAFFPKITEESRQKELPIIQREIIERAQSDFSIPYQRLTKAKRKRAYSNNPIMTREATGTEESIGRITVEKLSEYHSKFFVANNTVVTMRGDLNGTANLEEDIIETLSEIPSGKMNKPFEMTHEKPYRGREILELQSPNPENAEVNIFFQIPPFYSLNRSAMNLLNYILCEDPNSLIFQDMRESKGLVYSVGGFLEGHEKTGLYSINYTVQPKHLDYSLQIVDESVRKLKAGQFSSTSADAYKAKFMPQILDRLQNPGWIQSELTDRHFIERFHYPSTFLQRLEKGLALTNKDAIEAANQYLNEDRLIIIAK